MTGVIDGTDATFEQDVLVRSEQVPVVVDLWAPWCGPCRTLGPILEKVVEARDGSVELVKVNVDENPRISATFQVQSIPAVFALRDRQVVDAFVGAVPEAQIAEFVDRLAPAPSEADTLVAAGDELSLRRALELQPDHPGAVTAMARHPVGSQGARGGVAAPCPHPRDARGAPAGRRGTPGGGGRRGPRRRRRTCCSTPSWRAVKDDEAARQEFLDLLETLGPEDPRTAPYRKALAARLF